MKNSSKSLVNSESFIASCTIETPLGAMLALADENDLLFLSFTDAPDLKRRVALVQESRRLPIRATVTDPLVSIKREVIEYFQGTLYSFKTPIALSGTPFQCRTWHALESIPYGNTWSYTMLSENIGSPKGFRAVANANSNNNLAIIIPCHRVINKSGSLAGYYGGVERKEWLLRHEKSVLAGKTHHEE